MTLPLLALAALVAPLARPPAGAAGPPARSGSPASALLEAHADGPPPGHTGGFGEPTCRECHGEFDLNLGGEVVLEGLPASYEAGASYAVTVVLRSTEMEKAGFQAAVRFRDGERQGLQAGSLEALDDRTAVVEGGEGGDVVYAQQVAAGTDVESPERASWTFRWTAPPGPGAVVFHAAANSANGDDSPLGDLVYATAVELSGPPGPGASTAGPEATPTVGPGAAPTGSPGPTTR